MKFLIAFNTIESETGPLTHKIVGDSQDANYNTQYGEADKVFRLVSQLCSLLYIYFGGNCLTLEIPMFLSLKLIGLEDL